MHRRDFLKLSLMGSVALSATSLTAMLSGCTDTTPNLGDWKVLRPSDRLFFTSIAPVMLKGSMPTDPSMRAEAVAAMLRNMDAGLWLQETHNKKQFVDLMNLLNFAPARGLATGVWSAWDKASEQDIEAFLMRWRNSSIGLLNLGYNALNKLMCATWFSLPATWQQIGYPGPKFPELLIAADAPKD